MSQIVNDDLSGNYLVEVYARRKRVATFQTRTFEDAVNEAWKVYRRRQMNTNTPTRKVTVCRIWKQPHGPFKVTDSRDITDTLRGFWEKER